MKNKLRSFFAGLWFALLMAAPAWGYVYSSSQSVWSPGGIPMQIKLGSDGLLQDGTNYSTSVQAAMQIWNSYLGTVQFSPQILAKSFTQVNQVNDVYFNDTIEGSSFGYGVLAVTLIYTSPSVFEITETDIIFNTAYGWNSYRGSLQSAQDIRRVALHELGHVLGLTHPDENGQSITALMNSSVSNLDALAADDINGAQSLYRAPGQTNAPGNDNFSNATVISLASGNKQVTGTSLYATKESGEPDHDPGDDPVRGVGGASVWWRWTAPTDGEMIVTTQGSKFDTLLGVYTGAGVSALTLVGSNDDVESGIIRYSSVAFTVTSGTTYSFAVDGWDANSGPVVLNLNFTAIFPPLITSHPSNKSVAEGAGAQFSGSASGAPVPTYRWQRSEDGVVWQDISDDSNFVGAVSTNLIINRTTAILNGQQFRFIVTNLVGSATSNAAILTVTPAPPSILTHPLAQEVAQGGSVTFTVSANGAAPLAYQWFKNSNAISGATAASFILSNVDRARDAANYYVVVSNGLGSATSYGANLAVVTPPTFTRQPLSQSVRRYFSTSLVAEIAATGGANTFQWKKNGVNIGTAAVYSGTTSYYSVSGAQPADQGDYTLVVSNMAGSITSDLATLTVLAVAVPSDISNPQISVISPGNPATLTIYNQAAWGPSLTYQWYKNGQPILGANSYSYQIASATPAAMGEYFVTVTNSSGTGVSKTFYATIGRTDPLAYHWIDAKVSNQVVYFLYASAPRIARYDLGQKRWLGDWALAAVPNAFALADDYIYVASGNVVTRYNADFSNPTTLYTTTGTITGLLIKDQHLFIGSNNYPYAEYRSIMRVSGELVAQKTQTYGPLAGFSYSAEQGKLFAHSTMVSPDDIWSIEYSANGQFGIARDSPYHGAFESAKTTQVFANGSLVVEENGVVYRAADLHHIGSVGGYFNSLLPSDDLGYYVLRGGVVSKVDSQFQETGRAAFVNFATFLVAEADALIGFTQPSAAGQTAAVEEMPATSMTEATYAIRLNPSGRQIWSPQIFADSVGVVNIYNKIDRQIYRWSANENRYLESIPLASTPDFISYSDANHSYYYERYGYQARRLLVHGSDGTELPLHASTHPLLGLQVAHRFVLFADNSGAWSSHSVISDNGELVTWREWNHISRQYEWNEATRRMYFFRDGTSPNDLLYEVINSVGQITENGETPYHGDVTTNLPIRAASDGVAVLLGSGEIYASSGLNRLARLPSAVVDGVWLEGSLHTIQETASGTELQSWSLPGYALSRSTTVSGVPLRLLVVPGGRLLLVTTQAGVLSFHYFTPESLTELDPVTFGGAPLILTQPQSVTVKRGGTAALAVAAQGTAPLVYQWFKDDAPIPDANAASFAIFSLQAESAGRYVVEISNVTGMVRSLAVDVTVASLPVISIQPVSQGVRLGQPTNLTVEMSGTGPFLYQWMKGDVIVPYGTNATLPFNSLQLTDAGQYTVVVTGEGGSVVSATATVAVVAPPVITQQPVNQVANVGDEVILSLTVTSAVPASYQWEKGGSVIPGATEMTYRIPHFTEGDQGSYSVVVTSSEGVVTSNAATLSVAVSPAIQVQPTSRNVYAGQTTIFSIQAESNAPQTYQWLKNGTPIPEATGVYYSIPFAQAGDAGGYSVVINNMAGSVTSEVALLGVLPSTSPVITMQPIPLVVLRGAVARFEVAAYGEPAPSYRWQVRRVGTGEWVEVNNGAGYDGVWTESLSVKNVQLSNDGDDYRCIVTNFVGSIISNTVKVNVLIPAYTKLSAGRYHSLRVNMLGQVYATGTNAQGQLGLGHTTNITTAQAVTISGQTIVDVAAGAEHSLFLTDTKEVWATGLNATGQLGDGTQAAKSTPIQIATNAVGIAAGNFHSVILKADGSLWTAGGNDYGQLGDGTTTNTTVLTQVATGVIDLAAGIRQTLFLKADGTLWAMGNLDGSEIAVLTPVQIASNVKTMAAGGYHSLFVKTDGTLWAMGYNPYGQLGTEDTTDRVIPVQVATGVKSVAAGYFHSTFIKTDNSLWVMGYNSGGQLGDGTTTARSTPFQAASNVALVSASEAYTLFTKLDGSLWGTGYNAYGQFGNGTVATTMSPVQIAAGVILTPTTPTGLVATTGISLDRVQLTWTPQGSAAGFEVWRHTANNSSSATRIASAQRWAVYEDLAVTPGQGYYYWIKAVNAAGTSGFSALATTASTQSQTITFNALPDVAYTATPIALSATVSSGLTVTFSVQTGPASVTGNSLSLSGVGLVTVRASQDGDASYDPALSVDRSFNVTANFDSWNLGHFTGLELADPNISGPNAVYGLDGLPNLVKYALGLDPKVDASAELPEVATTATDWVYTYAKPASVTDVTFAVEVSTDLTTWTAAGVTLTLDSTTGGVQTWRATYPLNSATNAFFRLRVTQ